LLDLSDSLSLATLGKGVVKSWTKNLKNIKISRDMNMEKRGI
jgi:hypothetical protein